MPFVVLVEGRWVEQSVPLNRTTSKTTPLLFTLERIDDNHAMIPIYRGGSGLLDMIKFSDIFSTPQKNGIYKSKEFHGYGVKIINMGEIFTHPIIDSIEMKRVSLSDSELRNFSVKKGDLLFARRSLVESGAGKCSIVGDVGEDVVYESSIIRVRLDIASSNPRYFWYYFTLGHGRTLIKSIVTGAGQFGIRGTELAKLKIQYPPLVYQNKIAAIGEKYDKLLSNLSQIINSLENILNMLFRSWFIDFDPVKAKAEGKLPFGMDEEIAELFPDSFVDSELGLIPSGWEVGKLSDIAKITMGTSPPGESYCDLDSGILPLLNGAGDFNDSIIAPKQGTTQPTKIANDGDFVFCIRATIGNLSVCEEKYCIGRGVASARERNWFDRGFLHQTISNLFRVWEWEATGSVIKGITGPEVKNAPVVLPPESIRKSFENTVMESMLMIQKCMNLEGSLSTCLEALLPRLMSGELSIS